MALLKCPDCGNKVSDYAAFCPLCGCPISRIKQHNKELNIIDNEPNTASEKASSSNVKFLNKLTHKEIELIEAVRSFVKENYPLVKGEEYVSYYGFTVSLALYRCFLFSKDNGKLVLKYRKNSTRIHF